LCCRDDSFCDDYNYDWFECYCEELAKFHRDIEGYSALAWQERVGWEDPIERDGRQPDRRIISHDQDLLSIDPYWENHSDSPLEFVKRLSYILYRNPLYFDSHAKIQLSKDAGLEFLSDGKTCYVDNKKIAFWHFQSDFSDT